MKLFKSSGSKKSKNQKKKNDSSQKKDWRNLSVLPQEVVSKQELDNLQNEVINELNKLQGGYDKPQALFYFHKYIDSKFSKSDFDVESYYTIKQNQIDTFYALGLGDLHDELVEYEKILDEARKAKDRLNRRLEDLDPEIAKELKNEQVKVDDYDDLSVLAAELPKKIVWEKE